jgi:hypothetical protein
LFTGNKVYSLPACNNNLVDVISFEKKPLSMTNKKEKACKKYAWLYEGYLTLSPPSP